MMAVVAAQALSQTPVNTIHGRTRVHSLDKNFFEPKTLLVRLNQRTKQNVTENAAFCSGKVCSG